MNARMMWLGLSGVLVLGCASSEKKDTAAAPAVDAKTAMPFDAALVAAPGATADGMVLQLAVTAHRDLPALEVDFHLPAGVTAADPAALAPRHGALRKDEKVSFSVDVKVDAAVLANGADVTAEVVVPRGGVNKDTLARVARLGPPAPAQPAPAATGTDGTGKPIREARPAH